MLKNAQTTTQLHSSHTVAKGSHSVVSNSLGPCVLGIFQARVLEWVAISFSNAWKWKVRWAKDDAVKVLHSICQQNLENSAVATGLEKVSFHSNSKKGNAKERSNYHTIALISHTSKVMLKILQARLQEYVNLEFSDIQAGFKKSTNCQHPWIIKKAREFQKNIYFCYIDYAKAFQCVDHNKLWKILKRDGNTRPPDLPLEKSVCRSGSNS